jgi:hypothetical protein
MEFEVTPSMPNGRSLRTQVPQARTAIFLKKKLTILPDIQSKDRLTYFSEESRHNNRTYLVLVPCNTAAPAFSGTKFHGVRCSHGAPRVTKFRHGGLAGALSSSLLQHIYLAAIQTMGKETSLCSGSRAPRMLRAPPWSVGLGPFLSFGLQITCWALCTRNGPTIISLTLKTIYIISLPQFIYLYSFKTVLIISHLEVVLGGFIIF